MCIWFQLCPDLKVKLEVNPAIPQSGPTINKQAFIIPPSLHYAKVVKTKFEVLNFDKLILHQFSTKMSQIFNDGVKTSKFLKR